MALLFADEHVPPALANAMRSLGHTVISVRSISGDKSGDGILDEAVFAYATEHKMAVLTENHRHFAQLYGDGHGHYGIISYVLHQNIKSLADQIDEEINARRGKLNRQLIRVKVQEEPKKKRK